jgi:hypothetical protein
VEQYYIKPKHGSALISTKAVYRAVVYAVYLYCTRPTPVAPVSWSSMVVMFVDIM